MSLLEGCRTSLQPYVFRSVVALGFLLVCFLFFQFLSFNAQNETAPPPSCPTVDCALNAPQTNSKTPNCPSQDPSPDSEQDTIVLMWVKIPEAEAKFYTDCDRFNIPNCRLTDDRSLYSKAHGIVLHHWDFEISGAGHGPKEPRPWFQKWVWLNVESPSFSGAIGRLNNLFNVTSSYRPDSNIPLLYGYLEPVMPEDETFKLPAKDKLVCWIVSHWDPSFKRVQFYNELKKHIEISTYGKGFNKPIGEDDYSKIVSSCKFYLSFENSVHQDYITEKLFNPMMLGSVPIVLGPSRQMYETHVPGESFIHIDDFSSPKELAERLRHLDKNDTEYMRYFDWRKSFRAITTKFREEYPCKVCSYLQKHTEYQAVHDLNEWYWG